MPLRLHRRVAMIVLVVIIAAVNASTASPTAQGVSLRGKVDNGAFAKHNELLGTDPPYGAKLDAGPARVTLTFDSLHPHQAGPGHSVGTARERRGVGSATGGTGGRFLWLWLTGAGALVVAGVVMAQRLRRTRSGGGVVRRG